MISVYFHHATRTPRAVRLAWHNMIAVPRVGDELTGPMGHWVVTRVVWVAAEEDTCGFACVDVHVQDGVLNPAGGGS